MEGPSSGRSRAGSPPHEGPRTPAELLATRRLLPRSGDHPALNRLAELAARLLGSRAAQVSLLADEQLVAGGAGLAVAAVGSRTPVEDSLCTVTARSRGPLVVPEAQSDQRVADLPPVRSGAVGAYLGVPLVADDEIVGALCVFDPEPRRWSEGDLVVLQQLAGSAVAELELSALSEEYGAVRTRWELAIEAAGIGSFDYDLVTGELGWDERMGELLGFAPGAFDRTIEAFYDRLHPEDRARVVDAIQSATAARGGYEAEYRVVRPDGETRWVQARGRVLSDEGGRAVRLLGAAYDTTVVREGEARVRRLLETMSVGFVNLDREWRVVYVNAEAERVLGMGRDALLGGVLWELFPALLGTPAEARYRGALASGEPATFDAYYPEPLNGWYEIRAWPGPEGLSVYFLDITARRAAQEQAERAAARSALLARVASELSATLDAEEAVARLARLVVPTLADWCVVTLADDDSGVDLRRSLRDLASWHADPELRPLVERYAELRLRSLHDQSLLRGPLTTGEPLVVPRGAAERVGAALDAEARSVLQQLAPDAAAVLPLRAHGRSLGLLTLARSAVPGGAAELDLDTARDVASRAGLALDNARLYEQQRLLAEGLQRALLTPPPQSEDVEIAVRYEPAGEAAQVGGDWYDAFLQPGATTVVIGDVVGHDTQAAAAMGQVRGLLRGIAATTDEGPAAVLTRLDRAMELLDVGTTATAVLARLEQSGDERTRGVSRLRWSNAGHPPPLLLSPGGTVSVLASEEADLLLGIDAGAARAESEVALPRGVTVLFYTDGLVERRGQSLDEGIAALAQALAELADRGLDELCDELLARMLDGRGEDDVALTAVRLHPHAAAG